MGKNKSALKGDKPTSKRESSPEPTPSPSESDYSSDSSDDTVEDEDGEELTPAMDAAILRTLAKIRRKEGVYGTDKVLEAELAAAQAAAGARGLGARSAQKAEKPFLLKDLHRQNLLDGVDSDHEDEEPLTNVEAARRAAAEARAAFAAFGDDDSDDGEVITKREKDDSEDEAEDAAYREFLLEMGGGESEVRAALGMADAPVTDYREFEDDEKPKKKKKEEEKEMSEEKRAKKEAKRKAKRAKADEDFLMDYILNRGWIDREKKAVPTYEDIVGRERADDESDEGEDTPWGKIDEEEDFDEKAEEFETEYNFRFEEPGAATIVTHPRQIESAVRRGDDARKLKRQAREERKAAEKAAREAEVQKKKDSKRREMESQLSALKKELGDGVDLAGLEKVLEGEWDEAEWERVVGGILAQRDADDDDKPTWDDGLGDEYMDAEDEGDGDNQADPEDAAYTNEGAWDGEEWDEEEWDGPINMDADFISFDEPSKKKDSKKDKKKRRAADEDTDEPLSLEERAARMKAAADEIRDLDHEDEVGGLRTRFKYTRTAPQSFGLTPAEILLATDAELNSLVSIKHMQPYRRGGLGRAGVGLGRKVRDLKAKLARRRWGEEGERGAEAGPSKSFHIERQGPAGANAQPLGERRSTEDGAGRPGKRLGKKERQKRKAAAAEAGEAHDVPSQAQQAEPSVKRRKVEEAPAPASPIVELAEGAGEGKKRRRKKKKNAE
ncbi:hypothetical protein CC85DRAFT_310258 [Cutaneotrichosporon oleaginosum]|uniref:Kri1-like C-terminal domain-containing protein n=1 Tax=Cutaneotrichosporon oleaginosum TaxID=879819 RepID=A0A0J1BCQ6_9TREE|nr:uncharacterized protein CC85DRAFT_310258 [Cutaneotrichosporon oleaginosum]KLT45834.1 hypothetical protein CC85DRAFT_310258 [Cutaneotrichosporon oleaginosum]